MRCPRCSGAVIRGLDGPECFNCGRPVRPVRVNIVHDRTCAGCGTPFTPDRRHQYARYCRTACRVRIWTREKRAAA